MGLFGRRVIYHCVVGDLVFVGLLLGLFDSSLWIYSCDLVVAEVAMVVV